MSPAHHVSQRRWVVLVVVMAALVGGAVVSHNPGVALSGGPPLAPSALAAATDAESSAWYCTGQSTVAGAIAPGALILTNTTARPVSGSVNAVTDSGATVATSVVVPARGQIAPAVPAPESGTWISYSVVLSGGGVVVSQAVRSAGGWSEAPCESSTAQDWYFPNGVTSGSDALFIALFNPTSTPDVVDMSFVTPSGVVHPINFQGLVLQPGQTQVEAVSAYVQNQPRVSIAVTTRTGRIVASELQLVSGIDSGAAIVPGSSMAEPRWSIPQTLELQGGSSTIDIFNPGTSTEDVTVRMQLASGPLSPFQAKVLPDTTWQISTSAQTRIPDGDAYAAFVSARGGPGVVVGRTVSAPGSAQSPQAGTANAIDALTAETPVHQWVVAPPGVGTSPVVPGVLPAHLGLSNASGRPVRYTVYAMTPSRLRSIASGTLTSPGFISLGDSVLFGAGLFPLLVRADGPLAVSEDVGPSGTLGVVTMPAVALSSAVGG